MAEAECDNDSIRFTISNVGAGNMSQTLNYIVVEDEIMVHEEGFQLDAGQFTQKTFFANGSTFRIEAQQSPGHPGFSTPSAVVEACGGAPFSLGFINSFREDDDDYFISIDCQENIGSYDPNDKRAFPAGIGEFHYIAPYDDLIGHYLDRSNQETTLPRIISPSQIDWCIALALYICKAMDRRMSIST